MAGLPYPAYIDCLMEKGYLAKDDASRHVAGFLQECGLDSSGLDAFNSGDSERITQLFLHFDDAAAVDANLKAFQKENGYSDEEIDILKNSEEIKTLFPMYIHSDPQYYNRFVIMAVENIRRFVSSSLLFKKAVPLRAYPFSCLACQDLKGAHRVFLGIAGEPGQMAMIASRYAKKDFKEMNTKAYDSICELINCANGLFATELSTENIVLDIKVPSFHDNRTVVSDGFIYKLPVAADGAEIDILFSFDTNLTIVT
jgi:hypothetical protein